MSVMPSASESLVQRVNPSTELNRTNAIDSSGEMDILIQLDSLIAFDLTRNSNSFDSEIR